MSRPEQDVEEGPIFSSLNIPKAYEEDLKSRAASDIDRHRGESHIPLQIHVRRRQLELGKKVSKRKAIYLDLRYWILLRQAALDKPNSVHDTDLLFKLRSRISKGNAFFPISENVFVELMKQNNPQSRLATAKLIGELSLQTTLIEPRMRAETEIAYMFYSKSGFHDLHPIRELIWSKVSYVLGFVHPSNKLFDEKTELAVQKAFFDYLWDMTLADMIAALDKNFDELTDFASHAQALNEGIAAHAGKIRSFKQAYATEVRGIVDVYGNAALEILDDMALRTGHPPPTRSDIERAVYLSHIKNTLVYALEKDKARDLLRSFHILASLHASVRWNKGKRLVSNDLYDFNHAIAALAYCDAFLTERSLRTMVTQRHLALDKRYGCRVIADVVEAIDYVDSLEEGFENGVD